MFVFLLYNITFAELSLKEQSLYSNQIEQFFNKYDSKISKLNYDEKIQFYDKILKQANILLSKTKNEKKVYILTKLIQTTQNKKNSTIIAKQKSQIKTNENKVVQNYINSYT